MHAIVNTSGHPPSQSIQIESRSYIYWRVLSAMQTRNVLVLALISDLNCHVAPCIAATAPAMQMFV